MLLTHKLDKIEGDKLRHIIARIPKKDEIRSIEASLLEQVEKFESTLSLVREEFSRYDEVIGRYDEIICEKASKFSIEEIKLQTKQAVQNCEALVKDTCSRIVTLEDETKRVAVFNKHIVQDME